MKAVGILYQKVNQQQAYHFDSNLMPQVKNLCADQVQLLANALLLFETSFIKLRAKNILNLVVIFKYILFYNLMITATVFNKLILLHFFFNFSLRY